MKTKKKYTTVPGRPLPLGARVLDESVQFSLLSRHGESVTLVLFDTQEPDSTYNLITLDPKTNKTGDIWHIKVHGVTPGTYYGYLVDGSWNLSEGLTFNRHRLLLDPCARAISGNFLWDLKKARNMEGSQLIPTAYTLNMDSAPRSIVMKTDTSVDRANHVQVPMNETVIYELHVKGFTKHPSSGVSSPGTYMGLTEKIPYLKELGITSVELMPVQEFDEKDNINRNPDTGELLSNFWGYSTMAFYAPKASYSQGSGTGDQVQEFKEMVKSFHLSGIEVILDVVFNHTAEGDHQGPVLSFRGIDNPIYYILSDDKRGYKNYSGCGNTFNCNHPIVREFILDCLRYWVVEMNIDGFRFDLASILGRDTHGSILSNPPLIEHIEEDPILRSVKIIAEAWDAAGAYQIGEFPGRWAEWNGKFRDDVRSFWNRLPGSAGPFATRLTGSSDIYGSGMNSPLRSINFITCHDGFTLNDLVSYNEKHNLENGEDNRDGENHNISWNWGEEGPSKDPEINIMRTRQIKNYMATLLLSLGIPMISAGDEFRKTQGGNNNAYCQDNSISWINWEFLFHNIDIYSFTRSIIAFRKAYPSLQKESFFSGKDNESHLCDISWHGKEPHKPRWDDQSRFVSCMIHGHDNEHDLLLMFNSDMELFETTLPSPSSERTWKLALDTTRDMDCIIDLDVMEEIPADWFIVPPVSVLVLVSH